MPFEMDSTISIHAPREGGDCTIVKIEVIQADFNPRPPRGGRLLLSGYDGQKVPFQSTPPARGATRFAQFLGLTPSQFQSTPPARGATKHQEKNQLFDKFQSTPPARGATDAGQPGKAGLGNFNPRPP